MADLPREPVLNTPLRLSEIKRSIYGGVKFLRILDVGWEFQPAPGIIAKDIDRLGIDIRSYREPLTRAIRRVMMPSIRKNFDMGGRPEPGWDPLAEYTIKQRNGSAWPILVRSGSLRRVATSFSIWSINEQTAAIKELPSKVWYGNLHQEGYGSLENVARKQLGRGATKAAIQQKALEIFHGTSATPGAMQTKVVIPQREFAMFQEEDQDAIQEIFADWMEERADRVGRML